MSRVLHARPQGLPFASRTLTQLAERHGGTLLNGAASSVVKLHRVARVTDAGTGDITPVLSERYIVGAVQARIRGATLLVDERLAARSELAELALWAHPFAAWAFAELLDHCDVPNTPPEVSEASDVHERAYLAPRVKIGRRVTIAPGVVIGCAGFGWASGPAGAVRAIPQLGGVIIEEDVHIGANSTIDAGTIVPTIIRRGARLDAQVHVGHNCDVGEGSMLAAQVGLAGSVTLGKGVLVGGQAGFADHVTVGDSARIGAKSGVIGDIPKGAIVAGYPAVPRVRWLRALAGLYRNIGSAD